MNQVTHRSQGPSIDWDYMERMHPAIPVIDAVAEHVENQFCTTTRGKKHTNPCDNKGIRLLKDAYLAAGIYDYKAARALDKENRAVDIMDRGMQRLEGVISRWTDRRTFPRATAADWPSSDVEMND